jgi:hypothetical protein
MIKSLPFLLIFFFIAFNSFSENENPHFNYDSYTKIDFDSLIDSTPKATRSEMGKILNKLNGSHDTTRITPWDWFELRKVHFTAYLVGEPVKMDFNKEFGVFGNIYRKQLLSFMKNPPEIEYLLRIRTEKGKFINILMQNVLVDPLLSEGKENAEIEIYGWYYMNDEDGPMIVMAEFTIKATVKPK